MISSVTCKMFAVPKFIFLLNLQSKRLNFETAVPVVIGLSVLEH